MRSRNALSILLAFYLILDAGAARGTAPGAAQGERLHKAADYRRMSAKVVRKIALPKGYHEGLFYDGEAIWVANGDGGKIWVVDIASGAVLAAIEPISNFAEALTRITDDTYFATEWFDKKVYKARISGNRLEAEGYSSVAPDFPAGAVWTGKHLYVITWQRGLGTKFYLLEMDRDMKVLRKISIDKIQEPSQLAWDGGSLWITSWHNSMVHKIDIEKLEISGAFRFPEPRATGIAWDGKFMWVVGTHSDLYQLEVI